MGKYFGTDGFRGEANVGLTVEHAYKVGRFLGWYFGREKKCNVVIGKDTRRSSYMFEYSLVAGLTASGADVYLLHVTTTPSVSYVVRTEDFDCGIMISASHNPFYDNGIKLINDKGEKMQESVIEKIEQYIADIVFATRYPDRYGLADLKDMITFGGSPRASISLAKAARAYAFIKHRGYVVPEDVRAVAHDVLRHRIGLSYEAEASDVTSEEIVSRIINKVEVP